MFPLLRCCWFVIYWGLKLREVTFEVIIPPISFSLICVCLPLLPWICNPQVSHAEGVAMATAILWLQVVIRLWEAKSLLSCRCPQNHREGAKASWGRWEMKRGVFGDHVLQSRLCCEVSVCQTHPTQHVLQCHTVPEKQLPRSRESNSDSRFPVFLSLFPISNKIPSWIVLNGSGKDRVEEGKKNSFSFH